METLMGKHKKRRPVSPWLVGAVLAPALMIGGSAYAFADDDSVDVTLSSKNGSGISGSATYSDDSVVATASGMDPDKRYYSFVYGAGSDSDGDNPCILTGETLAGPINTVGRWKVDEDGNGTLEADAPVSVENAGTMSIREDAVGTGGAAGPLPVNKLVACGDVGSDQDTTLGDVQNQAPSLPRTSVGASDTADSAANDTASDAVTEDDDDVGADDVTGTDDDVEDVTTESSSN